MKKPLIRGQSCLNVRTYPAGRLRTAALVAVDLILRIGCPVTRLFQEYGSATRVPGVTTGGGLDSPTIEPTNKSHT